MLFKSNYGAIFKISNVALTSVTLESHSVSLLFGGRAIVF